MVRLLTILGLCAILLIGAYYLSKQESPASRGIRQAIERMTEAE
jgi:hypothetical protein